MITETRAARLSGPENPSAPELSGLPPSLVLYLGLAAGALALILAIRHMMKAQRS
jgi:hypothetical protein